MVEQSIILGLFLLLFAYGAYRIVDRVESKTDNGDTSTSAGQSSDGNGSDVSSGSSSSQQTGSSEQSDIVGSADGSQTVTDQQKQDGSSGGSSGTVDGTVASPGDQTSTDDESGTPDSPDDTDIFPGNQTENNQSTASGNAAGSSGTEEEDDRTLILSPNGTSLSSAVSECPACAAPLENGADFCQNCGTMVHTQGVFLRFPNTEIIAKFGISHGSNLRGELQPDISRTAANQISHDHLRFKRDGEDVYIQDLDSTNGTKLNGTSLEPNQWRPLSNRDVIKIADIVEATIYLPSSES